MPRIVEIKPSDDQVIVTGEIPEVEVTADINDLHIENNNG